MKQKLGPKAFTLIELLAVIFIVGIISLVVIPTIGRVTNQSKEELYKLQIENIITGSKNWATKNADILPTGDQEIITITLGQLKIGGFVDKNITNPKTKKLFPNDLQITITRVKDNFKYLVLEETGGEIGELDLEKPTIILNGMIHEVVELNGNYYEKGVIAKDPTGIEIDTIDVKIEANNEVVLNVNTNELKQYIITYTATYNDKISNIVRTVTVKDSIPPELVIPGNLELGVHEVSAFNAMEGVTTSDNSLQSPVLNVSSNLSIIPGNYVVTYQATDASGNKTIKTRMIKVVEKKLYSDSSGAFRPKLYEGMIPIKWDQNNMVKADPYSEWYDYNNKEWANVVLVTEESRATIQNNKPGTPIPETDVLAYLVWIPRYKYKLFNVGAVVISPIEIEVIFETSTTDKEMGMTNGSYLTHPAFTFGSDELEGFWMGKFETTGNQILPTVKPGIAALREKSVSEIFNLSKTFNNPTTYGLPTTADAHMVKNMEWGAVAYLGYSKYGKSINEVWVNPSSNYLTGCAGNSVSTVGVSGCPYKYNEGNGPEASTTGNVYGIYDMSGGSQEYVMGAMYSSGDVQIDIGLSGFDQVFIDNQANQKYLDKYKNGPTYSDQAAYDRKILGDATGETRGWNGDSTLFLYTSAPWFARGGGYDYSTVAGTFCFAAYNGSNYSTDYHGSRITIPGLK
ncbi:MAG: prepilin-type N-terminal cleavage/methylation domain-containing protein [Bacilli bacterium]|nr:prepilin-type N-terminal cleavage/methylation domain-containing protein [Bacilli bacterium]